MYPLFETIKIVEGVPLNIRFHQERLNDSFKSFYKASGTFLLDTLIEVPDEYKSGVCKCRFLYNQTTCKISFSPYILRRVISLKLVHANNLDYHLKFTDRSLIQHLLLQKGECDDILIVEDGFITDTSYSNILFFNGKDWLTPSKPLLKGTCRKRLLKEGKIIEADITINNFRNYKTFKLINAMLDIDDTDKFEVDNIL